MMQNCYKTRTDTRVMIHLEYIIIYDEDDGYIYIYLLYSVKFAGPLSRAVFDRRRFTTRLTVKYTLI